MIVTDYKSRIHSELPLVRTPEKYEAISIFQWQSDWSGQSGFNLTTFFTLNAFFFSLEN